MLIQHACYTTASWRLVEARAVWELRGRAMPHDLMCVMLLVGCTYVSYCAEWMGWGFYFLFFLCPLVLCLLV